VSDFDWRHPSGGAQRQPRTPIAILALAGLNIHHGALGAMRSAGRLGIDVYAIQRGGRSPVERSRYCRGSLRLDGEANESDTLEALLGFARERGRLLLLAVDDAAAMFVDDHGAALVDAFLLPGQPRGLARQLADKHAMHALCLQHGIRTPSAGFPGSEREACRQAEKAGFPVVLKRIDASRPTAAPGVPNVLLAGDRAQLLAGYRAMQAPDGANVMLQEHVPGYPGDDWMFNGYFDADSRCQASFTGIKLRQWPPAAGAATLGLCQSNAVVRETAERLMSAVGYRGALDLDFRFDRRDGRYKLLDVNPRIGSSFRLFVADDGTDVLRAMYLDLTGVRRAGGLPIQEPAGRRWLVEPLDLVSAVIQLRRGEFGVGRWLCSLRGVRETAWFAPEDPRPFLAVLRLLALGALRRLRPGRRRALRRESVAAGDAELGDGAA
jgi:predicted ATP-grasp superfamily ATP-dependent carboligase